MVVAVAFGLALAVVAAVWFRDKNTEKARHSSLLQQLMGKNGLLEQKQAELEKKNRESDQLLKASIDNDSFKKELYSQLSAAQSAAQVETGGLQKEMSALQRENEVLSSTKQSLDAALNRAIKAESESG